VQWFLYAAAGLVLCGAALLVWMTLIEPRLFRVRRIVLPRTQSGAQDGLSIPPDRLPPLKILHVTDTHFHGGGEAKLAFLRKTAQESFDFVFLTGDLMERPEGLKDCLEMAEILRARLGSFAVLGGHDCFFSEEVTPKFFFLRRRGPPPEHLRQPNPVAELKAGLAARGVQVLEDQSCIVRVAEGRDVAIVGLRDAFVFELDYDAAWRGVPAGMATIVLAHSPDVLPEVTSRGADLAFFGHTHGGQVRLPLVGAVVTRSQILHRRRVRGVFREGRTIFTINHGLGAGVSTNLRLLCRPEVTVMSLEP